MPSAMVARENMEKLPNRNRYLTLVGICVTP